MKLFFLRVLCAGMLLYFARQVWANADNPSESVYLMNAFYTGICVILGIANAIVWAPFLGDAISRPVTEMFIEMSDASPRNRVCSLLIWASNRGHRRCALAFACWEGIRHPESPVPFLYGLDNARPGSKLELIFAREIFRFDNVQHCLRAFNILMEHQIDPRPHQNCEVNLALISATREKQPPSANVALPSFPAVGYKRNNAIQLFEGVTGPAPEGLPQVAPDHDEGGKHEPV